jgi:hypothetical protein
MAVAQTFVDTWTAFATRFQLRPPFVLWLKMILVRSNEGPARHL